MKRLNDRDSEAMYILLCGTGVGFSVEHKYVDQLPEVPDQLFDSQTTISVADSKEGWAKALRQLVALLYSGEVAKYDLSRIRPAGARLKTFGGRASGPGPLDELFKFTIAKFRGAVGRKLTSIECHDLLCKIGEVVGDGKNLALQDIRFARTINRIQKSMLAELNKIAIVHLFLLGFEDELSKTGYGCQAELYSVLQPDDEYW